MNSRWSSLKNILRNPIILSGVFFVLGILVSVVFYRLFLDSNNNKLQNKVSPGQYNFISPLLSPQEEYEGINDRNALELRKLIMADLDTRFKTKQISKASVYFRDLSNGPWFGVNELQPFLPGSLLKVPLAMSVLNFAEENNQDDVLNIKIKYTHVLSNDPDKANSFKEGQMYTVRELLEHMILDSDNAATLVLNDFLKSDQVFETYKELGIDIPSHEDYTISAKNYASFFRILYNSSYISRPHSQYLLTLLQKSKFKQGIASSVPREILIANKYGVRQIKDEEQLHDCGIIYYPSRPYLLCIMTRGKDPAKLLQAIQEISKITYTKVSTQSK